MSALPLTGPSRTFVFDHELSYPVNAATQNSLWVLYDNGAFEFRLGGLPATGVYRVEDGAFRCRFVSTERGPEIGGLAVLGSLEGDVLTIDWDEIAEQADWQDAVYVLVP